MTIEYVPASDVTFDQLLRGFNAAYEGYSVPLRLEADHLHDHIAQNDIDLGASRAAVDQGTVVGVGLMGVREARGWVGGFGVALPHRRLGIGRGLMAALLDSARARGLRTVQLEVITTNEAAYQLYLSIGFETLRKLLILERLPAPLEAMTADVRDIPLEEALTQINLLHAVPPLWQRQAESIRFLGEQVSGHSIIVDGQAAAYAAARTSAKSIQFMDLAFVPGHEAAMRGLMAALHAREPEAVGRLSNLGEDDPAWPVLADLGYSVRLSQWEMAMRL